MTLSSISSLEDGKSFFLSSLFSEKEIILALKARERWEAIEELVELLVKAGDLPVEDREDALEGLYDREQTMSTGVGFGVAIPHAAVGSLKKSIVAFGRSQEGVEFEALDGKPVHFVFLILMPSSQQHLHLKTLSAIATFFNDSKTYHALLQAKTAAEIMELCYSREKQS